MACYILAAVVLRSGLDGDDCNASLLSCGLAGLRELLDICFVDQRGPSVHKCRDRCKTVVRPSLVQRS